VDKATRLQCVVHVAQMGRQEMHTDFIGEIPCKEATSKSGKDMDLEDYDTRMRFSEDNIHRIADTCIAVLNLRVLLPQC
jgi:hypothetical protein